MENEINLHKRLLSISLRSLNIETHSRDISRVCKKGERKYTINNNKKIVIIIFLPSLGSSFFARYTFCYRNLVAGKRASLLESLFARKIKIRRKYCAMNLMDIVFRRGALRILIATNSHRGISCCLSTNYNQLSPANISKCVITDDTSNCDVGNLMLTLAVAIFTLITRANADTFWGLLATTTN